MKQNNSYLSMFEKLASRFAFQILFIIIVANIGLLYLSSYLSHAQTCFTPAQVVADNRCLYIFSGKVFEKDTRSNPHKGHPCGMDVTSIILSFHLADTAKYLDPNYRGNICTTQPTTTPTIVPTTTPTPTLLPTTYNTPPITQNPQPTTNLGCQANAGRLTCYEAWRSAFTTGTYSNDADMNYNGSVSISDYETWRLAYVGTGLPANSL